MNIQTTQNAHSHVVVLGNEKGGSGKSTTAIHLITYLMYMGHRVLSIDTDSRQQSLTNYLANRKKWCQRHKLELPIPDHFSIPVMKDNDLQKYEMIAFEAFSSTIERAEGHYDYIVIDTPGFDTYLSRLAHSMADTLVTPINDSFIDLDVLGMVDPVTLEVTKVSHYAKSVQKARKQRAQIDGATIDWILVRNRLTALSSNNRISFNKAVKKLSSQVGCRLAEGISERVIFRSLFLNGMTVFDRFEELTLGMQPTLSHVSARNEYRDLVNIMRLPMNMKREQANAAQSMWAEVSNSPLIVEDIFAD